MASGSKTRYLILGLLSEGPLTGYEVKRLVDLRFSYFWNESYGQIYPELKRLRSEGLVEPAANGAQSVAKGRKSYAITDAGLSTLRSWLREPVEKEGIRFELLLKLYFGNETDRQTLREHMTEFRSAKLRQAEAFERFAEQVAQSPVRHDNHEYVLHVIDFGTKVWRAYLDWSDEVLGMLSDAPGKGKGREESL